MNSIKVVLSNVFALRGLDMQSNPKYEQQKIWKRREKKRKEKSCFVFFPSSEEN